MFKSKTNFDAFDTHNTKVANVEAPKLKALSKANLKKLAAAPGEETPFHLVLDYFKDKNDKPAGHFLDFGIHKKLAKHFEQVEMKPGKPDKRMSASPKEACSGMAYVEKMDGVGVLHFKPHEKSKIPMGKWAKIIKALKPLLGGMKAVVVIGEMVLEDSSEDTSTEEPTERGIDTATQALKTQWAIITKGLKETLPKEILPRIKNNTATEEDLETVQTLLSNSTAFQQSLAKASDSIQQVFEKGSQLLTAQLPKIKAIEQRLEALLQNTENEEEAISDPNEQALKDQIEALIQRAQDGLDTFEKTFKEYLQQPVQEPTPIIGGEDFLATIS